jgi:hypothetical protein
VELVTDRRGWVYVLDAKERMVLTFRPDGTPGPRMGSGEDLPEPIDLAVDDSYQVYVLDRRTGEIQIYGPGGDRRARFPLKRPGAAGIREPRSLAVDRSGALLVFDGKTRRVRRLL